MGEVEDNIRENVAEAKAISATRDEGSRVEPSTVQ